MGILSSFGRSFSRSVEVLPDASETPSDGLSVVLAKNHGQKHENDAYDDHEPLVRHLFLRTHW